MVGLGNPGPQYAATRHNVGFMVVDELASVHHIHMERNSRFDSAVGRGAVEGIKVVLAKPRSYMNLSGIPARRIAAFYKITIKDMLVIHDDVDLGYGRIKIKEKGGHGGHNGLKSFFDAFGSGDFIRLRVGVGRPGNREDMTGHVLGRFTPDEQAGLDDLINRCREAAESILRLGAKESMNVFNRKNLLT